MTFRTATTLLMMVACSGGPRLLAQRPVENEKPHLASVESQLPRGLFQQTHSDAVARLASSANNDPGPQDPIRSMALLSAREGWALAGQHLFWTVNAGAQWKEITPPTTHPVSIEAVHFLNGQIGSVLQQSTEGENLELVTTTDGGNTWAVLPVFLGIETRSSRFFITFADELHGWLMVRLPSGVSVNWGRLFSTYDGGRSWTRLSDPPLGEPTFFLNPNFGWIAGDGLYVTHDGGTTWQPRGAIFDAHVRVQFGEPRFLDECTGRIAVTSYRKGGPETNIFGTDDGGNTWTPIDQSRREGGKDRNRVIALPERQFGSVHLDGDETTFTSNIAEGRSRFPPTVWKGAGIVSATFATKSDGWLLVQAGRCASYKSDCAQQFSLLATEDGGRSYSVIASWPPRSPESINSSTTKRAAPMAAVRQSANLGFDTACAPDVATMATWFEYSPYYDVAVYLKSAGFCNGNPNLTSSWVSQVTKQGWNLIPVWGGPQPPFDNDTVAAQAGRSEALKAIAVAVNKGLTSDLRLGQSTGSIIYYDFETCESCTGAQSFVDSWVKTLHDSLFLAGIYSHAAAAAQAWSVDSGIPHVPDAVWIVQLTGSPVTTGLFAGNKDALYWPQQRIHQYCFGDYSKGECDKGNGHVEYYGPVGTAGIELDNDVSNGPLATLASPRSEPTVIADLKILDPPPYSVGQTIAAEFAIQNQSNDTWDFQVLTAGGRVNNEATCVGTCPDFTKVLNVHLVPGRSYKYGARDPATKKGTATLTLSRGGTYQFFVAYLRTDGQWNVSVPTDPGVTGTASITVDDGGVCKASAAFSIIGAHPSGSTSCATVSTPAKPTGAATGKTGTSYSYTTSGSSSSDGSGVQYRFSWGDGTYSAWLSAGSLPASHAWTSAGSYYVQAQARSTGSAPAYSAMSSSLSVTITGTVTVPTSLIISATLPSGGVAPYSAISVNGSVSYNTGVGISTGTATITTGEGTFTAVISNGAYNRTITAPSTSRNIQVSARDDKYGLTSSVSPFLAVLSNQSGDGYQLDRTTTSRDVQGTSPYDPIFETEFFRRTDTKALVWTNFTNLYRAIRTRFDYYGPTGNLETSYTSSWTDDPASHGYLYYYWWKLWSWVWINGSGAGYRPGRWSCQIFVDNGTGWKYLRTESFTIGYEFAEHRMAQGVSGTFDPVTPTNTFRDIDAQAYTWARLANVVEGLGVKWDFYEPNGSRYYSTTYDVPDPGADHYWPDYRTWGWISIAGASAAQKCGDWRVAVSVKDMDGNYVVIYTDYFQILESASLPPTASTATAPATPTAGQAFTVSVSASDTTYLKKVVLYWNDGTVQSRTWDNIFASSLNQSVAIGPYSEGRQIEMWAEAWDTSGNRRETAHSAVVISPALSIAGPASLPVGVVGSAYPPTTMAGTGGSAPYRWATTGLPGGLLISTSTGVVSGTPVTPVCPVTVNVTATDSESRTASKAYSLTINPATPTISAFGTFCANGSVTLTSSSGSGNQWFKDGLAIPGATGQTYPAVAAGSYRVQVTTNGCLSAVSTATNLASQTPCNSGSGLYLVSPCRLIDTRDAASSYGGPWLAAGTTRNIVASGRCGIPSGAVSLSVNVTVVNPSSVGWLTLFAGPTGSARPYASTINVANKTLANNAIVPLGNDGSFNVYNGGSDFFHFIIDVNGYFR